LAWLDAQVAESLYITSINTAELWAEIALMPDGVRESTLESSLDDLLDRLFGAIAHAHGFAVATRDVVPFRAAGIKVINPWEFG